MAYQASPINRSNTLKAIFGGTFDPPHLGHLRPLLSVLDLLGLESCELIPSHIPVHKQASTTARHRLAMTQLLAKNDERLSVNSIEIQRDTPSFSIDTITALNKLHLDENICFIMGLDTFLGLPTWFCAETILEQCHLIVMMRPTQNEEISSFISYLHGQKQAKIKSQSLPMLDDTIKQLLPEHVFKIEELAQNAQKMSINGILRASKQGEVIFVLNDEVEFSSTEIRQNIKRSKKVSQWLTDDIAKYIEQHELYTKE